MSFKNLNSKKIILLLLLVVGISMLVFFLQKDKSAVQTGKSSNSVWTTMPKTKISDFLPIKDANAKLNLPKLSSQGANFSSPTAVEVPGLPRIQSPALKKYPKPVTEVETVKTYSVAKNTLALQPLPIALPGKVSQSFAKPLQPAQVRMAGESSDN